MNEYVLGTSDHELARLELQQRVWGGVTERFLDSLRIAEGASALDLGCGPGFVTQSLRARVGTKGRVVALDESRKWLTVVAQTCGEHGWRNVHLVESKIEHALLEPASFDVVYARWVLSFLPELERLFEKLAKSLRPGGVLAIQDYNHEGVSLYPPSRGFSAIVRATRALYASKGGDAFVAGRLPALARSAGLELAALTPHVLAGAPGTPAFEWADAFFPYHSEGMQAGGFLSGDERDEFLRDWAARKADPNALFFSPIVVDFAARKPRAPGRTSRGAALQ